MGREALMGFVEYHHDADNGAVLAWRPDGKAFVILAEQLRHFSTMPAGEAKPDRFTVLTALDDAWSSNQDLFRLVTPKTNLNIGQGLGRPYSLAADLTVADRRRLHAIIDRNHKRYFASHPTPAQKDNLIDALGPQVAERLVKAALASNSVH
jgi:hypothetical protein